MTSPDMPAENSLGGRVGGRLAGLVVQAALSAKAQSGGHTANVAQTVLRDFTNHISDEIRGVMGPTFARLADHPDTSEEMRPLFLALAHETGQAWAWIGGSLAQGAILPGLLDIISNELAPVIRSLIATNPHGALPPATAAAALAYGLSGHVDTRADMRGQGLDENRQDVMIALASATLDPPTILDLLRRKTIAAQDARNLLGRLGYEETAITQLISLREVPLSPADAAAAWARNSLTDVQTDVIGAASGVSAEDMRVMRDLAGQPPSPEELLFAWRRGVLQEKDVDRGIIQGPIRNEWIPVIKALQWLPLGVAEAADAVNQGHMSMEAATRAAKENGVKAEDFKVYVDNAGIPPGPQEALDWVNRGLLTPDGFRTAFLESRIKNKYIDLYLASRFQTMPPETIRLMVSRGALTKEQGLHRLMERGYTPEDAAIIIDGASAEKTKPSKDLTVAQTLELRADGLISDADALAMLGAAGYDADEALWVTQLADLRRVSTFVRAAINRTKASYVAGRLSEIDAGSVLDQLGLPADFKDSTFALWDLERTTVTKGLTPAQIVQAVKKGLLSVTDGLARLVGQGYAADDANILLRIAGAIPAP